MKIGLARMRCEKGDISGNLATTKRLIQEAERRGIDILALPEASLTGYHNPSCYPEAVIRRDEPEMGSLLTATRGGRATILPGFIEVNPGGKPFLTQAIVRDGRMLGWYHKNIIQDEDNPDAEDADWFAPGEGVPVFERDGLTYDWPSARKSPGNTFSPRRRGRGLASSSNWRHRASTAPKRLATGKPASAGGRESAGSISPTTRKSMASG